MLGPVNLDPWTSEWFKGRAIDWVIVGSETGPKRRICHADWVLGIIDQCRGERVPCWVKQVGVGDCVTGDMERWPEAQRVRELP